MLLTGRRAAAQRRLLPNLTLIVNWVIAAASIVSNISAASTFTGSPEPPGPVRPGGGGGGILLLGVTFRTRRSEF